MNSRRPRRRRRASARTASAAALTAQRKAAPIYLTRRTAVRPLFMRQTPRRIREALPQRAAQTLFLFADQPLAVAARVMARAIRCAARGGGGEIGLAVRQAGDQHAVVEQWQHHRNQRGLLSAVQRRGRGEHRRRFARERAGEPHAARAVEKVFERRGHIAEAGGTTERKAGAVAEVIEGRIGRALGGDVVLDRLAHRRYRRHGAHPRLHARYFFHTAGDELRHGRDAAVAAVIQDKDVRHRYTPAVEKPVILKAVFLTAQGAVVSFSKIFLNHSKFPARADGAHFATGVIIDEQASLIHAHACARDDEWFGRLRWGAHAGDEI